MSEVNIPLLRKAVEWAEAEAAKPAELREWEQNWWVLTPEHRNQKLQIADLPGDPDYYTPSEIAAYAKAPACGTCYCIAGYIAAQQGSELSLSGSEAEDIAADALGLDIEDASALFAGTNSIEDVRRIAEEIAGERL